MPKLFYVLKLLTNLSSLTGGYNIIQSTGETPKINDVGHV